MSITLTLKDKTLTIVTREIEGQELYKAQDLLRGYYQDTKTLSTTLRAWMKRLKFQLNLVNENGASLASEEETKIKLARYGIVNKEGRQGGTYLTKTNLFKLAGYVSAEFEDAVYKAFGLLVEGKTDEALTIAQGVAKIERAKTIETNKSLKSAISQAHSDGVLTGQVHHRQIHFANLAFAYATGLSATKAKALMGTTAPRDYLVEQGDYEAVRKLEEAQVVIKTLLSLNFSYEQIKTHLNVSFK
ncbi:KilA-N domain-containing protein [Vibrio vulnificus]|nr:KilA-N domain-containing protein [Vibrio vulnificus]